MTSIKIYAKYMQLKINNVGVKLNKLEHKRCHKTPIR